MSGSTQHIFASVVATTPIYEEETDKLLIPITCEVLVEDATGPDEDGKGPADFSLHFPAQQIRIRSRDDVVALVTRIVDTQLRAALTPKSYTDYLSAAIAALKSVDIKTLVGPRMPLALMPVAGHA